MFQENHVRQDDVVVRQHNCLVLSLVTTVSCACVSNGQCCNKWTKKDVMDDDESDVEEKPCYENDN